LAIHLQRMVRLLKLAACTGFFNLGYTKSWAARVRWTPAWFFYLVKAAERRNVAPPPDASLAAQSEATDGTMRVCVPDSLALRMVHPQTKDVTTLPAATYIYLRQIVRTKA
jgi:hypothetical protein